LALHLTAFEALTVAASLIARTLRALLCRNMWPGVALDRLDSRRIMLGTAYCARGSGAGLLCSSCDIQPVAAIRLNVA